MNWSPYQKGVFAFNGRPGNGFVNAVAGSGKTTVIVKCIEDVPPDESVLAVAFGRDIKKTLDAKLGHLVNVTVKTLNGFGYGACRSAVKRFIKIDVDKVEKTLRFDCLNGVKTKGEKELFYASRFLICKITAIWKADMVWEPSLEAMYSVMDRFNLELPKKVKEQQFFELLSFNYLTCMKKTLVMDYDDQIAMPLYNNWALQTYDRIFVDEAQDLTPAQIELTRRAVAPGDWSLDGDEPGGKAIYVGDPRQAIYQFRGADSNAVGNIISTMGCEELPLSICYRCSKAVVRLAQKIVPHIEYHEDAPEGEEGVITPKEFKERVKEGDLVLSRCTAPLVRACLDFIKDGRKATVKGREIGQGIVDLIDEVAQGEESIECFHNALCMYVSVKQERLKFKPDALIVLNDTFEAIQCFYETCSSVSAIKQMISKIFREDAEGIMLMTGHKSKGLECTNVYILAPELIPHKLATTDEAQLSEENLAYVMVTRAKLNNYRVGCEMPLLARNLSD